MPIIFHWGYTIHSYEHSNSCNLKCNFTIVTHSCFFKEQFLNLVFPIEQFVKFVFTTISPANQLNGKILSSVGTVFITN